MQPIPVTRTRLRSTLPPALVGFAEYNTRRGGPMRRPVPARVLESAHSLFEDRMDRRGGQRTHCAERLPRESSQDETPT
jgi:hypothetical protein